jgi:hypothetical protein
MVPILARLRRSATLRNPDLRHMYHARSTKLCSYNHRLLCVTEM